MKTTPALQKGDLIAFASPARSVRPDDLKTAVSWFEKKGYKVMIDPQILTTEHQFAGSDEIRVAHFQKLLDDSSVKAIICTRGGYGSMRIIDRLDFSSLRLHPKWIVGYSDITVFHAHLQQTLQMESLHASMPLNFENNTTEAVMSLFDAMEGKQLQYNFPMHPLNRNGKAAGELVGGNLSILYSLQGSVSFPDMTGKILFIEDIDEYLYHVDRMMLSLKRAHVFEGILGLVVGDMTDMRDNTIPFGKTAEEIISAHIQEYDFPVGFGFPAGHLNNNLALIMGRKSILEVRSGQMPLLIQES
ncbi:MAG: LD-carboxypeptidase [Bacteroidetes bacterium HGW-Bacteroidetes-1]|jgi:muramoyltetrapeptide carboxypeptidase|nr:MAG: LD-carboxypeptidase [Bacteroidetes bacterium HGW-Bacteroidetes-1]